MPKILLTPAVIKHDLICPEPKRRIELCDIAFPGLYIECRQTSPGQGTYYLRYKDSNGKTCHIKIGRTNEITLSQARKKAKQLKAQITLGADPAAESKQAKQVITFSQFSEEYLAHARPRKRSIRNDESMLELRLKPAFGDTALNRITRQSIQQWHTGLIAEDIAPATANRHLALLRSMLNLAVSWGHIERNPADKVSLLPEDNKVERYMSEAEQAKLIEVLQSHKPVVPAMLFLFLLSTGARLGEALKSHWEHIDMEKRLWKIPIENAKSRKVRSVPLNDSALEVLSKLPRKADQDYMFMNARTGKPYVNVDKPWRTIKKKAGLPKLRIHDLRHQYASNLVSSGRSLYEVQQILGHSDPAVTTRYAHLSAGVLQDAANSGSVSLGGCPGDGAESG